MNIKVAKSAGFCFGVDRAVRMTYDLLDTGETVCTYGPLIHNPQVTDDLLAHGVTVIEDAANCERGQTVVVRTHGVSHAVMQQLEQSGARICDATCPFVKKIHRIVAGKPGEGVPPVLIAGDRSHPEIIGIIGHCKGDCATFLNAAQLQELLRENPSWQTQAIVVVAQTTFSIAEWEKCLKILNLHCTNANVFDTICNATQDRQSEALALAQACDRMIIIGGRASSNTAKLQAVCAQHCPTIWIEQAAELSQYDFQDCETVGVTAGASTPARIIKEVLCTMCENVNEKPVESQETLPTEPMEDAVMQEVAKPEQVPDAQDATAVAEAPAETAEKEVPVVEQPAVPREITDDMDFSEALEVSLENMNSDQAVKGIVMGVSPSEIQVDIGRKQTGYVPANEYSADPAADIMKEVKVGDEMNLIIMKTNDVEGTVMLSKRRYDAMQAWTDIVEAETTGEILDGVVTDVIRGGVLALAKGVKVFIPASLATASRNDPLDDLLRKNIQFRIIEVNRSRRRAVGSVRAVLKDQRKAAEDQFWAEAEVGKVYRGEVRSMTSYGAFVDLGGVDGMVHISELSWSRIKHPSDVLTIGDEVEVYIKALDPEAKRISLGYKKTEDNPWEILKRDYPVDSVVEAEVVGMTTFGAFARVIPGIDGLIHISQIANRHIEKPQDELAIGDVVQVKITAIDFEKKRVSLSIRALLDPMEPEAKNEAANEEIPEGTAVPIEEYAAKAAAEETEATAAETEK